MKAFTELHGDERGLTGLETIIAVIVFAIIAIVAMYVLFAGGMASAENSEKIVQTSVHKVKIAIEISGQVMALCDDGTGVRYILFTLRNTSNESAVDMTPCDGTSSARNKTIISLSTDTNSLDNIKWTSQALGANDGDALLEAGEQFEIKLDLADLGYGKSLTSPLGAGSQFTIQLRTARGQAFTIRRAMPSVLQNVMALP